MQSSWRSNPVRPDFFKKIILTAVLLNWLQFPLKADDQALNLAENFITTFYSWDLNSLEKLLAEDADNLAITYYQGWAEGANYAIKIRRPCESDSNEISCAITVTDDFGRAMGYTATDTFRLIISDGHVSIVTFSGDDPPIFQQLQEWIMTERPEVLPGPFLDLFAGGNTPHACSSAVAKSAAEFAIRCLHYQNINKNTIKM